MTVALGYQYNGANQLIQITYPSGRQVAYQTNSLGQVERVTTILDGITQVLADNFAYLPFGPLQSLTYGNGISLVRHFDLDYRLEDNSHGTILDHSYEYDLADNLTALTDRYDLTHNLRYHHDPLNRLIEAARGADAWRYDYDGNGNRTLQTYNDSSENYLYPATSHHLEQIVGTNARSFQYSANGNIEFNDTHSFVYAAHNRLSTVRAGGKTVADYVYNGHGERVQKSVAGATVYYHYGRGGQLLAETDARGAWLNEYLYLGTEPLAVFTGDHARPAQSTGGSSP